MTAIRRFLVTALTDGSGNATVYSPIHTIEYLKDAQQRYTDGLDFTITAESTGETIWSQSDVNAAAVKAPPATDTFDGRRHQPVRRQRYRGFRPDRARPRSGEDRDRIRRPGQDRSVRHRGRGLIAKPGATFVVVPWRPQPSQAGSHTWLLKSSRSEPRPHARTT
jgi:hypothetical protein